jgi:Bacterial conjugation TrbI-like protein
MLDLNAPEPTANLEDSPEPTKSFIDGEFVTPPTAPKLADPLAELPTNPVVAPPEVAPHPKTIDMASLVGLQPLDTGTLAAVSTEIPSPAASKPPLYQESWFQLAVVGGCMTIAGWLMYALMFGGKPEEKVAAASPEPTATTAPKADFAPDPAFGVMASKVAMNDRQQAILDTAKAQQAQAVDRAKLDPAAAKTDPSRSEAAELPKAKAPDGNPSLAKTTGTSDRTPPAIANNPDPRSTEPIYHPPAPVTIPPEPVASKPTPVSKPAAKEVAIKPAPVQRPVVIASRQVTAVRSQPQTIAMRVPPSPVNPPSTVRPPVTWKEANANATGVWGSRTVPAAAPTTSPIAQAQTSNISTVSKGKAVIGQQIKGRLISPIQTSATVPTQEIAISLERSIVSDRGKVLVPAGTQIVAQIGILDSGMMSILAAKATIEDREVDLPPKALILQASNRQPLLAELKQFGHDEIGRRDMMAMLGGAAQAIGKNLTEPQTSTVATAGGIIQNTNTQTNILGAGLNGFTPVAQQWLDRNQQAIQQINARSKVWYLGTGTEVNLVVAQPFAL